LASELYGRAGLRSWPLRRLPKRLKKALEGIGDGERLVLSSNFYGRREAWQGICLRRRKSGSRVFAERFNYLAVRGKHI
jgi:hypothetical protein